MSIGDVFAKAWELWRRDIGWLILAGLVVGLIVGVIALIVFAIVAGMMAVSIGGIAIGSNNSSTGITGLGVGTLIVAFIIGVVGYLIVSVLAMVFYGGLFEMVIGAARENRGVNFADLFGGFRKFGSFIVFWLVIAGISIGCGIVAIIPIIGIIAVLVFGAWLGTTWLYVLPLIADRGLTFGDAARTSSQMVKGVGWWKTFGTIIVLGAAFFAIMLVISLIGRSSSAFSSILTLIFEIAAGPFAICYVSTMYLGSSGEAVLAPAAAYGAPAPPAYGTTAYGTPPAGGQMYQPPAPPPITPPIAPPADQGALTAATAVYAPPPVADADVWKAAADPLAAPPPVIAPPLAPPVTAAPLPEPATEQTAAAPPSEPPAAEPAADAPTAPEPPAPPEAPKA
ncbi:MAG: glycerophosphoryl diester phosphodiesterase membrane domain-containing protein [Actinobacteria bacterium]|nr:glycerophosphoryl diester phosphodiesterase membrane domain-containing protein [Actinomycetota bacterium]